MEYLNAVEVEEQAVNEVQDAWMDDYLDKRNKFLLAVFDKRTGTKLLLDTGAIHSVLCANETQKKLPVIGRLRATNNTNILIYESRERNRYWP